MKKYLKNLIGEVIDSKVGVISYNSAKELSHNQFGYIGLDRLEQMIKEIRENNPEEKYVSMAEIFSRVLRSNLSKENGEIIHNYFELKNTLQKYYTSIEDSTINNK